MLAGTMQNILRQSAEADRTARQYSEAVIALSKKYPLKVRIIHDDIEFSGLPTDAAFQELRHILLKFNRRMADTKLEGSDAVSI